MARDGITTVTTGKRTKYRARYSFTDDTGTRRHRSKTFETKKAAQSWLTARRRELDTGQYVDPSPVTVGEIAARWLATIERSRASSTYRQYLHTWEHIVAPAWATRKVSAVRSQDVQAFYDALGETYRGNTVMMVHKVMRGIFTYAITDGLILAPAPTENRRLPKDARTTPRVWSTTEAKRFLDHAMTQPRGAVFALVLATGMRVGEALALTWDDIDMKRRTARIHRTVRSSVNGPIISDAPKTHSSNRTVALPALAIIALEKQCEESRDLPNPDRFVFVGREQDPISVETVRLDLKRMCDEAGVPRLQLHGFRRTAATIMLERGVNPGVAAKQLGHSVEMMLKLYAQVSTELLDVAAGAIDEALNGGSASKTRHEDDEDDD